MKNFHVNPEESIFIHKDIKSKKSIGMHFGTFVLTTEPINEPEKLLDTLLNECKHFYDKATQCGYSTRHILAARYWLCVILDEVIQGLPNPNKYQYPSLLAALNHSSKKHF